MASTVLINGNAMNKTNILLSLLMVKIEEERQTIKTEISIIWTNAMIGEVKDFKGGYAGCLFQHMAGVILGS